MTNEPPQDDDPDGANPFKGTPFEQFFGGIGGARPRASRSSASCQCA